MSQLSNDIMRCSTCNAPLVWRSTSATFLLGLDITCPRCQSEPDDDNEYYEDADDYDEDGEDD